MTRQNIFFIRIQYQYLEIVGNFFFFLFFIIGECKNTSIPNIPQVYRKTIGEEISGSITLCGNPQPNVTWYIGETIVNGSVVKANKEDYQYIYSFKTTVTSDMCGKNISYIANAENTFQNKSTSLSKIFVENCKLSYIAVYLLKPP